MSKPSQLKSRQQKSVSKSPVGKCQIGKIPHTKIIRIINELPCAKAPSVDKNKNYTANPPPNKYFKPEGKLHLCSMKCYHTWTWLAAAKPASSSILSRVIVEQKSRDEAVKEQQKTTDKQEKAVRFS